MYKSAAQQGNKPDLEAIRRDVDWDSSKQKGVCPLCRKCKLSVSAGRDVEVVVKCWGECDQTAVAAALGLSGGGYTKPQTKSKREATSDQHYEEYLRKRDALLILRAALGSGEQPTEYLAARGIDYCPPQAGIVPIHKAEQLLSIRSNRAGSRVLPKDAPVMTFPIIKNGKLQGVHTTVLNMEGTGKLNEDARRVHGVKKGGFIPLWEDELNPDAPLLVGEGVETTLSAMVLSGYQGVSAVDSGNFASVCLPPCGEIIVLQDRDEAGHKAVESLIARYGATKTIRIAAPPEGYKDWNDALQSDLDREDLKRRIDKAREAEKSDFKFVLTMGEFRQLNIPSATCVLSPILRLPGRSMISARSGSFKTRLALSIAYAAATGQDLMDWHVDRPYRVMFVDAELDPGTLIEWLNRLGPNSPNLHVVSDKYYAAYGIEQRVSLATPEDRQFLSERVYEIEPDLIILDNYFELAPVNMGDRENSEALWPEVKTWIEKHGKYERRHVLLLHHDNKSGDQFGSSHKERDFDLWAQLKKRRPLDTAERVAVEMSFRKSRHLNAVEDAARVMTLNTEGVCEWQRSDEEIGPGRPAHNQERDDEIRRLRAEGVSVAKLMEKFNISRSRVAQITAEAKNGTLVGNEKP